MEFAGLLIVILGLGAFASVGADAHICHNREAWMWTALIIACGIYAPNVWAGLVIAVIGCGMFSVIPPAGFTRTVAWPAAGIAGGYVVMSPYAEPWHSMVFCAVLAAIGAMMGGWAIVAAWALTTHPDERFQIKLCRGVYLFEPHLTAFPICGQGNPNHTHAVAALAMASCLSFVADGVWWMWGVAAWCGLPIAASAYEWRERHWQSPGQGVLHCAVAVLALAIFMGWLPLWGMALAGVLAGVYAFYDGGALDRWQKWSELYHDHLARQSWSRWLIGSGMGTFRYLSFASACKRGHRAFYVHAHNEYYSALIEYGIVGLGVLCAYLATAVWQVVESGSVLVIPGVTMLSIAAVSFPWSIQQAYRHPSAKEAEWNGSPALVAISFALAVVIEGVTA